jgi:hypothetical protein
MSELAWFDRPVEFAGLGQVLNYGECGVTSSESNQGYSHPLSQVFIPETLNGQQKDGTVGYIEQRA